MPGCHSAWIRGKYEAFSKAYYNGRVAPDVATFIEHLEKGRAPYTITYQRIRGTNNFEIHAYNLEEDKLNGPG